MSRFRTSHLFKRLAEQQRLEREMPFSLRIGDALLNGTIDALLDDGTLLDYKPAPMRKNAMPATSGSCCSTRPPCAP